MNVFLVWRSFFLENTSKAEARILKRRYTKWVASTVTPSQYFSCKHTTTSSIVQTSQSRSRLNSSLFHSASSYSPHDVSNCSCWRHVTCLGVSLSSQASLLFSMFPICAQSSSFSHLFFRGFIFISNLATFVFVTSVHVGRRLRRDWIGVICYRWESDTLQTSHRPIEFLAFKNFPLISEWLHYFFSVECRPHARCVPQNIASRCSFWFAKQCFCAELSSTSSSCCVFACSCLCVASCGWPHPCDKQLPSLENVQFVC